MGQRRQGWKDWVGKGFNARPHQLPHAYRETTFGCFKSGKTPREKRSRGREPKHTGSLRDDEDEAPLPGGPLWYSRAGTLISLAQKRRTLSTVFVIQHACAILLLEWRARRYRDSRVQVSQIQRGRSSWAQTRTRETSCSNLGSLRPDQQLTPYDGPLSGTHSLAHSLPGRVAAEPCVSQQYSP